MEKWKSRLDSDMLLVIRSSMILGNFPHDSCSRTFDGYQLMREIGECVFRIAT